MLVSVEKTGFDETLNAAIYTETHKCDRCGDTYSFGYSCCYDIETVRRMARNRNHEDFCRVCRDIKEKGFSQPALFDF